MKQAIVAFLALVGAAALVGGGVMLWLNRPGRTAVAVNGRVLTDRELNWRAQTLIDDARRVEHLLIPEKEMPQAMRHYRKLAAKMWIVKEVLLAAAVEAGVVATATDEKDAAAKVEGQLRSRNLTLETFFKEGPIPEETKRADFRESLLIEKFTKREISGKISVNPKEVDDRIKDLKEMNARLQRSGGEPKFKTDRKSVIEMLRQEKHNIEFRNLFRERFGKMQVECPAFPDLENVDGVSPPRKPPAAAK